MMMDSDMRRDDEHYFPKSLLAEHPMLSGVTARLAARPDAYTRRFEDGPWHVDGSIDPNSREDKNVFLIRKGYGVQRRAALKIVTIYEQKRNQPLPESERARRYAQMHRECEIMDRLKGCTNIVTIYGHFTFTWHEDDQEGEDLVILMEYLPHTLAKTYDDLRFTKGSGRFDEDLVFKVGLDLCAALRQCSHVGSAWSDRESVLHRDIKPSNIFHDEERDIYKLGDFGISRFLRDERQQASTVAFTPNYAAPERLRGEPYDIRADIYGIGLVLYGLCNNGRLPKDRSLSNPGDVRPDLDPNMRVPSPAHGIAALQAIIVKACAYAPRHRYQTIEELEKDLAAVRSHGTSAHTVAMTDTASVTPEIRPETHRQGSRVVDTTVETVMLTKKFQRESTDETVAVPKEFRMDSGAETVAMPKKPRTIATVDTLAMSHKRPQPFEVETLTATAVMPPDRRAVADVMPTVRRGGPPDRGFEDTSGSPSSESETIRMSAHSDKAEGAKGKRSVRVKRRLVIAAILVAVVLIVGAVLTDYSSRANESSAMQAAGIVYMTD